MQEPGITANTFHQQLYYIELNLQTLREHFRRSDEIDLFDPPRNDIAGLANDIAKQAEDLRGAFGTDASCSAILSSLKASMREAAEFDQHLYLRDDGVCSSYDGGLSERVLASTNVFLPKLAELHERLLADPSPSATADRGAPSFVKAGKAYIVKYEGIPIPLTSSKGVRALYKLIGEKAQEFEANELNILIDPPKATLNTDEENSEFSRGMDGFSNEQRPQVPMESLSERDAEKVRGELADHRERAKLLSDEGKMEAAEVYEEKATVIEAYLSANTNVSGRARRRRTVGQQASEKLRAAINSALCRQIKSQNPALYSHLKDSLTMHNKFSYSPEVHIDWRLT